MPAIFIAKQGVHKMCRMHMEDSRMRPNIYRGIYYSVYGAELAG